jgi:hypothetical protein
MTIGSMVARLLALALAIGLVVGALAWRDRGDGGGTPDPTASPTATTPAGQAMTCAAETGLCDALAAALPDLDVAVVNGPETAGRLATADTSGTWVTLESLTAVVADARQRGGEQPLLAVSETLATSPLVLVAWNDRAAVLTDQCGAIDWACIGQVAPRPWSEIGGQSSWGRVKPAHAALDRSGIGGLAVAQAAASFHGTAELSTTQLDQLEFQSWFDGLERAIPAAPTTSSYLQSMLVQGRSAADVVGTTEAEVARLFARAGTRADDLLMLPSTPAVFAEIVIATPVGTTPPADIVTAVREAAAASGWRVDGQLQPGAVEPVEIDGEPVRFTGGLLEALRLRWERVRR